MCRFELKEGHGCFITINFFFYLKKDYNLSVTVTCRDLASIPKTLPEHEKQAAFHIFVISTSIL